MQYHYHFYHLYRRLQSLGITFTWKILTRTSNKLTFSALLALMSEVNKVQLTMMTSVKAVVRRSMMN